MKIDEERKRESERAEKTEQRGYVTQGHGTKRMER